MAYKGVTNLLEISIFKLYSIPTPISDPQFQLITSDFSTLSDIWLPANSKFKFFYVQKYGTIMFAEFEQGTLKNKYLLQARHLIDVYYTDFQIEGEPIVT